MATIKLCNHKGDQMIAEYDPANAESVKVADDKLATFLAECVAKFGTTPPVWARRTGMKEMDVFRHGIDNLNDVEDVVLQYPLVGG